MISINSCFDDFEVLYCFILAYFYTIIFVCYYVQKLRYKVLQYEDTIYKNNCVIKLLQKDIIDLQDNQNNISKYRYAMF